MYFSTPLEKKVTCKGSFVTHNMLKIVFFFLITNKNYFFNPSITGLHWYLLSLQFYFYWKLILQIVCTQHIFLNDIIEIYFFYFWFFVLEYRWLSDSFIILLINLINIFFWTAISRFSLKPSNYTWKVAHRTLTVSYSYPGTNLHFESNKCKLSNFCLPLIHSILSLKNMISIVPINK